jgi:hypothetical protein
VNQGDQAQSLLVPCGFHRILEQVFFVGLFIIFQSGGKGARDQMHYAERMSEARVFGAVIHQIRRGELFYVPQSLKRGRIHYFQFQARKLDEAVYGISESICARREILESMQNSALRESHEKRVQKLSSMRISAKSEYTNICSVSRFFLRFIEEFQNREKIRSTPSPYDNYTATGAKTQYAACFSGATAIY